MGLFDRIGRVIRANVNAATSNAEDPEKILEQTVAQMQTDLVQLRQAVASAIATQKRTQRQAQQAEATAAEWYRRAQIALQQENDALARDALTKRRSYQETATAMSAQIAQQNSIVTRLKQDMQALESKISEAKSKKDMYIARARSAEATTRINEMLGGVNTASSLNAFEQMETQVLQLEAQSELISQMGTDDLEKKFDALAAGSNVDTELAQMKAQMLTATQNQIALPDANPPKNSGS